LHELARTARKIVVSGTGDGGLIDALRMIHDRFRNGKLATDLAIKLSATGIRTAVAAVERNVEETCNGDEKIASTLYFEQYMAVIEETPPRELRILADSYYRDRPIQLVGELPHPFSLYAAPIHKFMIAHAIKSHQVEYTQGRLKDGPTFIEEGEAAGAPVDAELCLARHGSVPPLADLGLTPTEIAALRENQLRMADLLNDIPYTASYWATIPGYPMQDPASKVFANFRHPLASAYINSEFDLTLGLCLVRGRPTYMIEIDPERPSPSIIPEKLFGIPLDKRSKVVADDYT
jgi:hypothetical protein